MVAPVQYFIARVVVVGQNAVVEQSIHGIDSGDHVVFASVHVVFDTGFMGVYEAIHPVRAVSHPFDGRIEFGVDASQGGGQLCVLVDE